MNLLKESTDQFRNAFLAMPMASRVIAGMLVVAIVVGLGILIQGGNTSEDTYLFGGESFNEQELSQMELGFADAGLRGWTRENKRIKVPSDAVHEYLKALADAGTLPSRLESAVSEALNQSNPLELSDQFKFRVEHARAENLSRQLQMWPDIEWAAVQYDESKRGWSNQHRQTASVTVAPLGDRPLSPARERKIKEFVSGSYANLDFENVVVIDTNSSAAGSWDDEENELLATKRRVENDLEIRIRQLLSVYGDIGVGVTAEIDPILRSQKTKIDYTERTPLHENSRKLKVETQKGAVGGVAGAAPNGVGANQGMALNDTPTVSTTSEDQRSSQGVIGQTYEQTEQAPLLVRRVTASIRLPKTYYETTYRTEYLKQNPGTKVEEIPPMTPEQYAKRREEIQTNIQSAVAPLLPGGEAGEDRLKLVTVWDYEELPTPPAMLPGMSDKALSWLARSWQTVGLIGLALVALLIARSVAKNVSAPPPAPLSEGFGLEIPKPIKPEGGEEGEEGTAAGMQITGGSLKEELTELIEKNPDVAANVLRSWIGDAA
ncbi:beta-cystathionase [Roseimaritima sediminicola]|uniref:beta-cystathionase n=1 Tax=Roseimaritima sediminicola TaxID=2662066 RepID=UPI0012982DDA|nr:beta-cystathionase [Roseimaritima sediminicola]